MADEHPGAGAARALIASIDENDAGLWQITTETDSIYVLDLDQRLLTRVPELRAMRRDHEPLQLHRLLEARVGARGRFLVQVRADDITVDHDLGQVAVSPAMCAALDALASQPGVVGYWLTDWTQQMRHQIELLPGRDWPNIVDTENGPARAREWAGERWDALPWWKWWALEKWLAQHPGVRGIAWADDRLHRHALGPELGDGTEGGAGTIDAALRARGIDALLVAPDKHVGLRPDDLRAITSWLGAAR